MWTLVVFAYIITVAYAQQQNGRRPESHDNGHGWDIRLAVPGEPGGDYPTLNVIPRTSFSCSRKSPGYYADTETGCQVFRVCTLGSTYGFQSFLCPNGTLFNQEVFVCDWWMNVNCDRTQQLFNENREKFGNLKLGPQLMKDIKKMLTHPMRNPYDKSVMKSNLIVMQQYKPPSGQLFPIGALISGPERTPSNIYIPAKQRQANFGQNSFISEDLSYAASTPSSQYIPLNFNTIGFPKDIEILQQQRQSQSSNGYTGLIRAKNSEFTNSNSLSQSSYNQNQNNKNLQSIPQNIQNSQLQRQPLQYNSNMNSFNQIKQSEQKVINTPRQQHAYIPNQNGQLNHKSNIPQIFKEGTVREAQQNSVNPNNVQPAGKTLKFSRIVQKSSTGNPKSRITFKTWIVRPSKTARFVAEPTPYTYDKPLNSPSENIVDDTAVLDKTSTTEKFNPESENLPYVYNRPTPSNKQIIALNETPLIYLPPTVPTFSNSQYSTSKIPQSPKQSHLDLPPTTYKPASRFYVPPSQNSLELSRQYLNTNIPLLETNNNHQSARLVVTPTTSPFDLTTVVSSNNKNPSFSLIKQSHINTNHNNLSFADILTKEKLDITVNNIVKNTNDILKSTSPDLIQQYRQNNKVTDNLPKNQVLIDNEIDGKLRLQPSPTLNKSESEKLIATPSTELEPPITTSVDNYGKANKLVNLPFFIEPAVPTNTIERTVSLKITIPETIAEYLFKNHSLDNPDNLEILNTGSSNYLVLTNSHLEENNSLIPIGKLFWDKNINASNSQTLVYSFLADSLNAAKVYSNIAKQNIVLPTSTQVETRNINNEDIGDITDKISQLTTSQFAKSNSNNGNVVHTSNKNGQYNSKQIEELTQGQPILNHQTNSLFLEQSPPNRLYSSRLQTLSNNLQQNSHTNTENIYSGQLYKLSVPEVTHKIYNSPNYGEISQFRQSNELAKNSQRDLNDIEKQSNTDVEIISSESLPYPPLRQQLPRTEEYTRQFFNEQDNYRSIFANNFLNSDNTITAQVQDKITGSIPHPLEESKLVTYEKNKSYYLYSKLDDGVNNNMQPVNTITETNERNNLHNAKLVSNSGISNRVTFELFPAIGYELEDENGKQQILNVFKINDFINSEHSGKSEQYNQRDDNLVTGIDFTILHPSSKKQSQQNNNGNTILYRGPSSYLAPQSSVGSLGGTQQTKNNAKIEQLEDNNGYSKTIPAKRFSF